MDRAHPKEGIKFTAMPASPVLVVLYNHRHDANIPVLDALYGQRFGRIVHLVPFHPGEPGHVLPVYGHSHVFQGFVAQALAGFHDEADPHAHYLFVADDLLLHPAMNERNYREHLALDTGSGFLPGIIELHRFPAWWRRLGEAIRFDPNLPGVEAARELPTVDEALERFALHGLEQGPIPTRNVLGPMPEGDLMARLRWVKDRIIAPREGYRTRYPLVGSYADLFAVPGDRMKRFAHLCGVFAATGLFAELAIPTAMVLAVDRISTERDTRRKGGALWNAADLARLDEFGHDLDALLERFPDDLLYLHPVKLSRWHRRGSR